MKTFRLLALALFSFIAITANAVTCHATPTTDDVAFYDKAVVSAARNMMWDGYNANIFARGIITDRRLAYYGLPGIVNGGPLTDDEAALWDQLVLAAIEHSVANTGGGSGIIWLDPATASQWAHGLAWVSTYYRQSYRC